ncbi:MAG: 3-hydroxyacyl-CoA dehydrogenase [Chloroflexi bacterium]|nr:3-hydroxyacyl-CoA dehydrogenase [Chloroflexota bacterium]
MTRLGVVGGGTMGAGVVQVAAQQGMDVVLLDVRQDLLDASVDRIRGFIQRSVERGRMSQIDGDAAMAHIQTTTDYAALADADCVIEAALEDIKVKSDVFHQLDEHCRPDAILATNTSSLSVTEIGATTKRPDRVVGLHFFNPVPLMALVEVVRGQASSQEAVDRAFKIGTALGKTPVRAEDTPGFIVNRVVRPFYNEALRILSDGAASVADIDRIMKGVGFRMGPFELMDLIGNDINFAATTGVYRQYFDEPRFRPSLRQQRAVQGGLLGQKTGRGWYERGSQASDGVPESVARREPPKFDGPIAVLLDSSLGADVAAALASAGLDVRSHAVRGDNWDVGQAGHMKDLGDALNGATAVVDCTTGGLVERRALLREVGSSIAPGVPIAALALTVSTTEISSWCAGPGRVCGFGYLPPLDDARIIEVAPGLQTGGAAWTAVEGLAAALDRETVTVGDNAGLVATRIVALITNEAAFALSESVATAGDIDLAVRLGVNYPHGPLEWADLIGIDVIYQVIEGLHREFGEDRYRPAPILRKMTLAGWTGRKAGRGFFTY